MFYTLSIFQSKFNLNNMKLFISFNIFLSDYGNNKPKIRLSFLINVNSLIAFFE